MASQNNDKGLCRLAVTLVSGSRSPMSSGGTRYREEATVRVQMGAVCSLLPPHRPPQAFPRKGVSGGHRLDSGVRLRPQFPRPLRGPPGESDKDMCEALSSDPGTEQN